MQPKESKSNRHFYFSIMKSILRFGACYGLWLTGDMMLQTVGVFFGLAEVLGIAEELQVDDMLIRVKMNYYKGVEYAERNNR